jgi:hypothetical protein
MAEKKALLGDTPLVVGKRDERTSGVWVILLDNIGGGSALNIEAWVELDGIRWTGTHSGLPTSIVPNAPSRLPTLDNGSTGTVQVPGPAAADDGVNVAIVARYLDKAHDQRTTKVIIAGPDVGTVRFSPQADTL